jgi:thiol-disulfide isomerase/thioredoxin
MDPVGVATIVTVLVLGTAAGLWRRRTDGRLRDVPAPIREIVPDVDEEPGVIDTEDPSADGVRLDPALLAELGVTPARATLLQFSSAFCAPCRAVRRVSSEVAALVPGVRHVEVDAESHLEAVRALGIWRTPTLLVLDAGGRVAKRATGVPAKPQLIAVLGDIL